MIRGRKGLLDAYTVRFSSYLTVLGTLWIEDDEMLTGGKCLDSRRTHSAPTALCLARSSRRAADSGLSSLSGSLELEYDQSRFRPGGQIAHNEGGGGAGSVDIRAGGPETSLNTCSRP